MSTLETSPPPPVERERMLNCGICNHRDCDFILNGCGCAYHARCAPSATLAITKKRMGGYVCPKCKTPSVGMAILPLPISMVNNVVADIVDSSNFESIMKYNDEEEDTATIQFSKSKTDNRAVRAVSVIRGGNDTDEKNILSADVTLVTQCRPDDASWTVEELSYVNSLAILFNSGVHPLLEGSTLLGFLSKMLNCSRSRITKKFDNLPLTRKYVLMNENAITNEARAGWGSDRDDDMIESATRFSQSQETFLVSTCPQDELALSQLDLRFVNLYEWIKLLLNYLIKAKVDFGQVKGVHEFLNSVKELSELSTKRGQKRMSEGFFFEDEDLKQYIKKTNSDISGMAIQRPRQDSVEEVIRMFFEPSEISRASQDRANAAAQVVPCSSHTIGQLSETFVEHDEGLSELFCTGGSDEEDSTDEDFLTLWGYENSNTGVSMTKSPYNRSDCSAAFDLCDEDKFSRRLGRSIGGHSRPCCSFLSAKPSVVLCPSPPLAEVNTAASKAKLPFLARLCDYVKTGSLPFEHFDVWMPAPCWENEVVNGCISPRNKETSATPLKISCNTTTLVYAGHVSTSLNDDGFDGRDTSAEKWQIFGEYSSQFQFQSNQGLPGRVHCTCLPCWEEAVNLASPEHFKRVEGASIIGIQTAVGIPVLSASGETIVVGCYSTRDLKKNDELVKKLWKDMGAWNPVPQWKRVIENCHNHGPCRVANTAATMVSQRRADKKPDEGHAVQGKRGSDRNEHGFSDAEAELLKILTTNIPVQSTTDTSQDLLHGYMALRMLLLRPLSSRSASDKETLSVMLASYLGYTTGRILKAWSPKELGDVIVKEYLFLLQSSSSIFARTTSGFDLSTGMSASSGVANLERSYTCPKMSPCLVGSPRMCSRALRGIPLMHPVSPVTGKGA